MDFEIPAKFKALRQMIDWIGETYLRPLGIEADRQGGALDPAHPFFKEALKKGLTGGFVGKIRDTERVDDGRPRFGARRAVVLAERAAYWDRGMATSLPGPGLGAPPLMLMGNEDQKKRFLGMFKQKETPRWAAFAMSEPGAGSDVARIRTRARQDGDHWVIDGEKCFISNGARASWVVVWATVDPSLGRGGHRAFIVEKGTPGFTVARVEHKMGLRASETAGLVFDGCRVPAENLLTPPEKSGGFKGAMKTFDMVRPLVAAMAVGMARACYDEAARFAESHFTGPSAWRLERVGDRLAEMRRKIEMSRLLAWRAAWLTDHRKPNSVEASMAKATCAGVGLRAATLGLDILGEVGGGGDYLIEKLFRDVKALDIVEGTGQIQRLIIARRLIGYAGDHQRTQGRDHHGR